MLYRMDNEWSNKLSLLDPLKEGEIIIARDNIYTTEGEVKTSKQYRIFHNSVLKDLGNDNLYEVIKDCEPQDKTDRYFRFYLDIDAYYDKIDNNTEQNARRLMKELAKETADCIEKNFKRKIKLDDIRYINASGQEGDKYKLSYHIVFPIYLKKTCDIYTLFMYLNKKIYCDDKYIINNRKIIDSNPYIRNEGKTQQIRMPNQGKEGKRPLCIEEDKDFMECLITNFDIEKKIAFNIEKIETAIDRKSNDIKVIDISNLSGSKADTYKKDYYNLTNNINETKGDVRRLYFDDVIKIYDKYDVLKNKELAKYIAKIHTLLFSIPNSNTKSDEYHRLSYRKWRYILELLNNILTCLLRELCENEKNEIIIGRKDTIIERKRIFIDMVRDWTKQAYKQTRRTDLEKVLKTAEDIWKRVRNAEDIWETDESKDNIYPLDKLKLIAGYYNKNIMDTITSVEQYYNTYKYEVNEIITNIEVRELKGTTLADAERIKLTQDDIHKNLTILLNLNMGEGKTEQVIAVFMETLKYNPDFKIVIFSNRILFGIEFKSKFNIEAEKNGAKPILFYQDIQTFRNEGIEIDIANYSGLIISLESIVKYKGVLRQITKQNNYMTMFDEVETLNNCMVNIRSNNKKDSICNRISLVLETYKYATTNIIADAFLTRATLELTELYNKETERTKKSLYIHANNRNLFSKTFNIRRLINKDELWKTMASDLFESIKNDLNVNTDDNVINRVCLFCERKTTLEQLETYLTEELNIPAKRILIIKGNMPDEMEQDEYEDLIRPLKDKNLFNDIWIFAYNTAIMNGVSITEATFNKNYMLIQNQGVIQKGSCITANDIQNAIGRCRFSNIWDIYILINPDVSKDDWNFDDVNIKNRYVNNKKNSYVADKAIEDFYIYDDEDIEDNIDDKTKGLIDIYISCYNKYANDRTMTKKYDGETYQFRDNITDEIVLKLSNTEYNKLLCNQLIFPFHTHDIYSKIKTEYFKIASLNMRNKYEVFNQLATDKGQNVFIDTDNIIRFLKKNDVKDDKTNRYADEKGNIDFLKSKGIITNYNDIIRDTKATEVNPILFTNKIKKPLINHNEYKKPNNALYCRKLISRNFNPEYKNDENYYDIIDSICNLMTAGKFQYTEVFNNWISMKSYRLKDKNNQEQNDSFNPKIILDMIRDIWNIDNITELPPSIYSYDVMKLTEKIEVYYKNWCNFKSKNYKEEIETRHSMIFKKINVILTEIGFYYKADNKRNKIVIDGKSVNYVIYQLENRPIGEFELRVDKKDGYKIDDVFVNDLRNFKNMFKYFDWNGYFDGIDIDDSKYDDEHYTSFPFMTADNIYTPQKFIDEGEADCD